MSAEPIDVWVQHARWNYRPRDCGPYHSISIYQNEDPEATRPYRRRVEVSISPTGRSIQVYVDGQEWGPK